MENIQKKHILLIAIVVLVLVIGALVWKPSERTVQAPTEGAQENALVSEEPTSTEVLETDQVEVGSVDQEFNDIDAQLNNL